MKQIKAIIGGIAVLVLFLCTAAVKADYEKLLFDTSRVHTIDIWLAEEDWRDLLAQPEAKTKYSADVVIDGEPVRNVAFSAKGSSSLAFVSDSGISDRYSFKVKFGKYVKGQN